ncbi:hypothetical protein CQA53_10090 [Helicobacter didelphidarum]|uniref:Uncharacterized protein n=1 Tax=Helicobacter didelphidarum TaxID=2040648 RepID=A0A3D8I8M7_9HELI|nr:hypothetical protein [Helicobacter didelphidarum]RDU61467.1 hypothetical protein CQA53_10090 [Helicobacter didelphidarum]
MNEIKNTEHLSQKDKESLQYFFEKYTLSWYVEREYKRLQNKTPLEQQGESAKEGLATTGTTIEIANQRTAPTYNPNIKSLNTAVFEFTEMARVITKPIGNIVNFYDAYIEYEKTRDGIKVVTKIASNNANTPILIAGTAASLKSAIATGAASSTFLTPVGGTIVGIGVFVIGVGTSYWVSDNFGTTLNAGMNGVIDFIRENDLSFGFTQWETERVNVAHCHKTMERLHNNLTYKSGRLQTFGSGYNERQIFINDVNVTHIIHPNKHILPRPNIQFNDDEMRSLAEMLLLMEKK